MDRTVLRNVQNAVTLISCPKSFTQVIDINKGTGQQGQWCPFSPNQEVSFISGGFCTCCLTLKTIEMVFLECVEIMTVIKNVFQLAEFRTEPEQCVQGVMIYGTCYEFMFHIQNAAY